VTSAEQVRRCLVNIQAIVEAAGGTLKDIVKTKIYLTDMNAFGSVNEIYADFFSAELPARGVIETTGLPKGALVAMEAIASID
jgi:2-iminobutanoate/2-iminopropanoate deaminase